jgi:Holliday junction resolvase RusA-like endonuclease
MSQYVIELPFISISLNRLYRQFRGRTIISAQGRDFKRLVSMHLRGAKLPFKAESGLLVQYIFQSNKFFTKDGRISKTGGDVDNCLKAMQDVVFQELGLDDSLILELYVCKMPGPEKTTIIFYPIA